MRYAFFPGCKIPFHLEQYGLATRAVLGALDVDLVDVEFNCCGYPVRHASFEAFVLSAARNMALAGREGLAILTPCKCCFGALKHADHWMAVDGLLRREINRVLKKEGLQWEAGIGVGHLLTVLAEDVGFEAIKARVERPYRGLKVAAQYGCHALRPGNITDFDDPLAPSIFEKLVAATGAESVDWPRRLECCGSPLWEKNNRLSLAMTKVKIADAEQSGATHLCTACTYCQTQFDAIQADHLSGRIDPLPAILYPQLLGLSLGLPEDSLGLGKNRIDLDGLVRHLT